MSRSVRSIRTALRIRVSKPGRRIYKGYRDLKPILGGMGIQILSTPRGVLSDRRARAEKVGGEVLALIH